MAVRSWTALLLLAAVFPMHGPQCSAAVGAPRVVPVSTVIGPAQAHVTTAALTTRADLAVTPHSAVVGHVGSTAIAVSAVPAHTGHGGVPHDAAGHLWTLCLAVLAAGLAVLLAALPRRPTHLFPPAVTQVRSRLRSLAPRPPELSALCLLRI